MLTYVLLTAALVLPLWTAFRRACARTGVRIDHVVLFSFGFIFYGITPILLGVSRIGAGNFALSVWYAYFDANVGVGQMATYLSAMLLFYGAFVLGSYAIRSAPTERGILGADIDFGALSLVWPVAVAFGSAYVWSVRTSLFHGYTAYSQSYKAGGTLSAVVLILLSFVLLRTSFAEGLPAHARRRGALRAYIVIFCVFALVLLSLGGRLYVVSSATMVLTYLSVYRRRLPYRSVLTLLAVGVAAVGSIGVIRLGRGGLSPLALAENVFGEPLFTSFSLLNFLGQNRFDLFNVPRFLAGDILNLVPSFLFPTKSLYLPDPAAFGYVVYAPLGALHMFFSFMVNFGLVGSVCVLGGLGAWLSWIGAQRTALARVIYSMTSGCLAFTLFRDPFSVSLVKNMFEFSILVPTVLTLGAHVVSVVSARQVPQSSRPTSTL
jgi:hypothetical protein